MTTVETDEPLAEENHEYLDMLGQNLGVREVVLDDELRGAVFAPFVTVALTIGCAYLSATSETVTTTGVLLLGTAMFGVLSVKWSDEAICLVRGGYTCHKCADETERWEVDS